MKRMAGVLYVCNRIVVQAHSRLRAPKLRAQNQNSFVEVMNGGRYDAKPTSRKSPLKPKEGLSRPPEIATYLLCYEH